MLRSTVLPTGGSMCHHLWPYALACATLESLKVCWTLSGLRRQSMHELRAFTFCHLVLKGLLNGLCWGDLEHKKVLLLTYPWIPFLSFHNPTAHSRMHEHDGLWISALWNFYFYFNSRHHPERIMKECLQISALKRSLILQAVCFA